MSEADGRTEEPTGKRRSEARDKGQVAKSMELSTAFLFIASIFVVKAYLDVIWSQIVEYTYSMWTKFPVNLSPSEAIDIVTQFATTLLNILAPIFFILFVVALAVTVPQVGWHISWYTLKPDLNKLNPIQGFKRYASIQPYVMVLQSIFKLILLGILSYAILAAHYPAILSTVNMDLSETGIIFSNVIWELCWKLAMALMILGIIDMMFQKYQFEKSLKMTKQEIKDETKNTEGDPLIKSQIRKKQQQMARKRMMQELPKADVVVTNPTHFAIAIRYDSTKMAAPTVTVKGAGLLAQKIKELAKEFNVPIVENPPLARSIYKMCDVDDEIPTELYAAVSEVLVYVYRLTGKI